ncbi:hypothetical protein IH992_03675 [Candidatus Poribacteria bacterium]|nr:hypothetical protein [Candidatus Poribacteria bacterium]
MEAWESLFWKAIAAAGTLISGLAGLYVKSCKDRFADKDKQIAELSAVNERINSELAELYKSLIAKKNER